MDLVLNALKCVDCREFLSMPVNLPCGHMICQSHTQVTDEQIICSQCGIRHQNKEFKVNEAVAVLIQAQLCKFDFGQQHKDTSKSCNDLKRQLDKNDAMVNDLDYLIHESINELKNRVTLKSEQLKLRIDEITQELIDELDEYERRCKVNCRDKDTDTGNFTSLLNEIKKQNDEAKKSWKVWSSVLNELKFDVDKWTGIKLKCDETLESMNEKVKEFEKKVFINELDTKKCQVEIFEKLNINMVHKKKVKLYSYALRFFYHLFKINNLDKFRIDHTRFRINKYIS